VTGNYRLGDIRHNVADISAIHEALGFTPRVSFAQGLGRFVDWVQEQEASVSAYQESLKEMRDRNLLK
jgi:dTDP-L-rhamnose 4-epimerase